VCSSGRGEGKGESIWLIYFVYVYENKTMKTDKILLRRGEGKEEE
jgi:hypothetical protein